MRRSARQCGTRGTDAVDNLRRRGIKLSSMMEKVRMRLDPVEGKPGERRASGSAIAAPMLRRCRATGE
jgi:hypothetical protein